MASHMNQGKKVSNSVLPNEMSEANARNVRSEETAVKVENTHAKHSKHLSLAIVPGIRTGCAFDKAVTESIGYARR